MARRAIPARHILQCRRTTRRLAPHGYSFFSIRIRESITNKHRSIIMARIVVAMSGGVDSSVAAALLKEQGHEVIGIMLRLWSEPGVIEDNGVERVAQNKCCSLESVDDARRVARMLDIPFYLVNVEKKFKEDVGG